MDDQLDPLQKVELALLRAEHQKRFQVMIEYIKEKVGAGVEYRNALVRVVLSENGAYYELLDLPEEFAGAVGEPVEAHFITEDEAVSLLTRTVEATQRADPENTRQFSVLVLYTRRGLVDRRNCYVFDYRPEDQAPRREPLIIGQFLPGVMPLFYKIKLDAEFAQEVLDIPRGIVFCMANAGERHLMVRIPYQGDQVIDLGNLPTSQTIQ
ncbi:MAG TPA: hypothetical protein VFB38_18410 [Chthonomonadaceae bacterium]|nr:hypothetical protein [Chthonomonadaceae bacterium]